MATGPNPTLFTSCEGTQKGWGALHINGLLTHPPPKKWGGQRVGGGEKKNGKHFPPPSGLLCLSYFRGILWEGRFQREVSPSPRCMCCQQLSVVWSGVGRDFQDSQPRAPESAFGPAPSGFFLSSGDKAPCCARLWRESWGLSCSEGHLETSPPPSHSC